MARVVGYVLGALISLIIALVIRDHWLPSHSFWTWVAIWVFISAVRSVIEGIFGAVVFLVAYRSRGYWR